MSDDVVDELVARADSMRDRGDFAGALRVLQRLLGHEPDHAYGHAALAHCLLMLHRLPAARTEAELALSLDPEEPMGHFSLAAVAIELGDHPLADAHVRRLAVLEPDEPSTHRLSASLAVARGDLGRALQSLREAVRLHPYDAEVLAELGDVHRQRTEAEDAERCCGEALSIHPRCLSARVLRGRLDLEAGRTAEAADHARFVLRTSVEDADALDLLTDVKAAGNPVVGLWWRIGSALGTMSDRQLMGTMLVAFIAIQVVAILAEEFGYVFVAVFLRRAWLALCAYTWVAPTLFRRALERELG